MLSSRDLVFVLAPAIVYRLRAKSPWLAARCDGWRVWAAVVFVAVALRVAVAYALGEPLVTRALAVDGIIAGLAAAGLTTGAQAAGKPLLDVLRGAVPAEPTPENSGAREVTEQDVGGGWGPGPSDKGAP